MISALQSGSLTDPSRGEQGRGEAPGGCLRVCAWLRGLYSTSLDLLRFFGWWSGELKATGWQTRIRESKRGPLPQSRVFTAVGGRSGRQDRPVFGGASRRGKFRGRGASRASWLRWLGLARGRSSRYERRLPAPRRQMLVSRLAGARLLLQGRVLQGVDRRKSRRGRWPAVSSDMTGLVTVAVDDAALSERAAAARLPWMT